ncbi:MULTISPECIES: xanthine dehydrogenase subunit XdhA [unclassified Campylobacter]|uniref:xanthine dehydrogenase subunit XdhA n=1 Tax=unclassified Campylobacter TaxID=2593542 RepID=UPI001BDAA095|nr:xanthine dehydrogenase subunit XdhA [Campylobacter sp. 2018MI13]MBT0882823.1 xanthine dehydrogenase molybdenum-binding subunit XdhA [Campylobacter sp. 2018MI13]MBZ7978852.1 xanthine dehydrogenase molybdenum-binding subunit XdhA [Campylobacter sp. RM12654]MBZ7991996.1 xanthine dehydrogenase molybdenum-binding subunit XdhA [Campylobacter sp. RM9331]MBZ8006422.1 xanthine dehydrogenase molybdenum-binding subunit XdhA [Campylobacter sp. RM9332]
MKEEFKTIGKSETRWDAYAKVTGKAIYTADIPTKKKFYARIVRSSIAHGYVKSFDFSEALKVDGVIKILTYKDMPKTKFATAGHPFGLDPKTRDRYDRTILTEHVRLFGDEIAAVIATTDLAAKIAVSKVKVEYDELPFYLTPQEAMQEGAAKIHEDLDSNIMAHTISKVGDVESALANSDYVFSDTFKVPLQQHCHMENQIAYAYKDQDNRYVVVSSTQIPHILRRILGEVFEKHWSYFRVIKPFVGGGFGNKQEVTIEPLCVALSMAMGGEIVQIALDREESIAYTRTRHEMEYKAKMGISKDGFINALDIEVLSNKGAYASHTHSVGIKGGGVLLSLYNIPNFRYDIKTVHTNIATAGAMRGYGVPQVMFFIESFMENVARKMGFDSISFREKNIVGNDVLNPLNQVIQKSAKLKECIEVAKEKFNYYEKQKACKEFKHPYKKRGVGLATFTYTTGVYPKGLETAAARVILNQDAHIKLMLGSTEIGQGSDTVLAQMAAEVLSIPYDWVIVDANTDTDTAPFDTGAYASRQSYVTGLAVKEAALKLKTKILKAAARLKDVDFANLDLENANIVFKNKEVLMSLADFALHTTYDWQKAKSLSAFASVNCHTNSYSYGITMAMVEVDMNTGKIEILDILNVHDAGKVLNPLLASSQVEGGMGMAIPYALLEELKYDKKTGKILNNNLLDYKVPTALDVPDLDVSFVDNYDPYGPFGNKSLGEPPMCSPAPAIRNAVLDATNIEFNQIPITPERFFQAKDKECII